MNIRLNLRLVLSFIVVLALVISAVLLLQLKNSRESELLVVWGRSSIGCTLLLTDPYTQRSSSTVSEYDECDYMVANVEGTERLVHVRSKPGEITIYNVTRDGGISIRQRISTGQVEITSPPQWGRSGIVYVSGILNERERIYSVNSETGEISQVTDIETGMAYAPVVSPDGTRLAYLLYEGASNRHQVNECFEGCKSHYYMMNVTEGIELALLSFVNNPDPDHPIPHCELTWSPTGQFLAFRSGCGVNYQPQQIIVVDVEHSRSVATIEPILSRAPYLSLRGWISEKDLVYKTAVSFLDDQYFPFRGYIYSIEKQEAHELVVFPSTVKPDTLFEIIDIDWTADGKQVVGVVVANFNDYALVIGDAGDEPDQTTYLHTRLSDPSWSPSGNWIAYRSGQSISLADKTGSTSHAVAIPEGLADTQFAWLRPSR